MIREYSCVRVVLIDADDSVRKRQGTHVVFEDTNRVHICPLQPRVSFFLTMYINGTMAGAVNNSVEAVFEQIVREKVLQLIVKCVKYCQCSLLKEGKHILVKTPIMFIILLNYGF